MKTRELRQKSESELQKILQQKKEKLQNLRFDLTAGKLKNFQEIKQTKRDIARILTILNQKSNIKMQNKRLNCKKNSL